MDIRQFGSVFGLMALMGCTDASQGVFGESTGSDDGDGDGDDGSDDGSDDGDDDGAGPTGSGGGSTTGSGHGGSGNPTTTTGGSGGNGGEGGNGGSGEQSICYFRCIAKALECGFGQGQATQDFCEDEICNQDLTDAELDCMEDMACATLLATHGDACIAGGAGGSGGSGGSGGAGGSGGSGGSGGAGGSGGSNPGPVVGKLEITVVPELSGNHWIVVKGDEIPFRQGGPVWGTPTLTNTGTRIIFDVSVLEFSAFEFSAVSDPPNGSNESQNEYWMKQLCDPATLKSRAAVWASFDPNPNDNIAAKPTAKVVVKSNGSGGCEFRVVAQASSFISVNDKDGDGFTVAQGDCVDVLSNDGAAHFPAQVESPDDNADLNCNGHQNPKRAIYAVYGVNSGLSPVLHDMTHWPATFPMHWVSGPNRYETDPIEMSKAPVSFLTSWACSTGTCYDSSFWGGTCHEQSGGIEVRDDQIGGIIPETLQAVGSPANTCHRVVTDPAQQLVP